MVQRHRCEGSLAQKVSIYSIPIQTLNGNTDYLWCLAHYIFNYDYSNYNAYTVNGLVCCPFCGKKLGK